MRLLTALIGPFALLALAPGAFAGSTTLTTQLVANGLTRPLYVTAPEGDTSRIFVLEQFSGTTGRIRIVQIPANTLLATPFLSISNVSTGNEQGLLGLAFHPDYLTNGYFFVYFTNAAGNSRIMRYRAMAPFDTSNLADSTSNTLVLSIAQPFSNHNGGWIGFGPDGYLYIASGDGGSGNDPQGNGQSITTLLGKMLRIDVDGADDIPGNDDDDGVLGMTLAPYTNPPTNPFVGVAGNDEIWAYGLRNPWRNSFDRATGDLYIADVGQNAIEEINFQDGASSGGENYGWRCMEGTSCTGLSGCVCNAASLELPIHEYSHSLDGFSCSVTGGYVYRGCAMPDMNGLYFYADYCSNQIRTFEYTGVISGLTNRTAELDPPGAAAITSITSFGEDARGEIYICDQGGEVYKIVPATEQDCNGNDVDDTCDVAEGTATDCNANQTPDSCELAGNDCNTNGQLDSCDIALGASDDDNSNGIPDECEECFGDLDGSGDVGLTDVSILLAAFGSIDGEPEYNPAADINDDGVVDIVDLSLLLGVYGSICP